MVLVGLELPRGGRRGREFLFDRVAASGLRECVTDCGSGTDGL